MIVFPTITEKIGTTTQYYDVPSRLFKDRIIMLVDEVNEDSATSVISQLLYLDSENHDDITLLINSPGGSVIDGLAIFDTMNRIKSDVITISTGQASSMGALLLSSGAKGKRKASVSARIMIHSIGHGYSGKIDDTRISHQESEFLQSYLTDILVKNTGQKISKVKKDIERDKFMSSSEALAYGIIDEII
jgi:ATP-dependent Clp protease protease subunit